MSKEKRSSKGFIAGMLTGGIIGGFIAVLYTPKSGKAVRRDITHKKDELKYNAGKYLENAKEKVSEIVQDGKEKAGHILDDAKIKANNIARDTGNYLTRSRDRILKKD